MTDRDADVRDAIVRIFELTRQTPGSPYAGRPRWVRFMNAVQLELGICFTQEEWDRGFGLEELVELAAAKRAKPEQQLRLARKRREEARRRCTGDPIKFALLWLPILVGALAAGSWLVKPVLVLLWVAGVGGVVALVLAQLRYNPRLVNRIEG
jgi:hypothetical protein